MNTLHREPVDTLRLNDIGRIRLETAAPLFFDSYRENRATGSFILIDPSSNFTAGAGMIAATVGEEAAATGQRPSLVERVARAARAASTEAEAVAAVRQALEELLL